MSENEAGTTIPRSRRDLVECPPVAALSTMMPDGTPQTTVVWCDYDGRDIRVTTVRGFAKEQNMQRCRRVALLCYDARRPYRHLEVRGRVVEMTEGGAAEHLDAIASKYAGHAVRYYGDIVSARLAETEVPILCRIRPIEVFANDDTYPERCGIATVVTARTVPIPASHLDLLTRPVPGVLTSVGIEGNPESLMVWPDVDTGNARVSTTLSRDLEKCLGPKVDRKASLLVVDPDNLSRFMQIRGMLGAAPDIASGHASETDTDHPDCCPPIASAEQENHGPRVIGWIQAKRITLDAIHA